LPAEEGLFKLKENIARVCRACIPERKKKVQIFPGYDGAFGTIQLFTPQEKEKMIGHL